MKPEALRFCRYLSFKMDCLRHQESHPLTLDVEKAQRHLDELTKIIDEKCEALAEVMPTVVTKYKNKPKDLYKQDGTYSVYGKEWVEALREFKLPMDTEGPIPVEMEKGNPNSVPQIKSWLESLGWKPDHFKYSRNKINGEEKRIPQVKYTSGDRKGELTDSVVRLKKVEPNISEYEGLSVATHRRGVFEGYLKALRGNTVVSGAGGFTNTLRLKHRAPIVNLPKVDVVWGKEIRGCIVAPAGEALVGSDVSSLESCTKRHYMWPHDPEYVTEMSQPGFDEHINLAKFAGAVSQEDEDRYIAGNGSDLKGIRNKFKPANYAGIYGVREKTLSRQTGMSIKECQELLESYWKRNWAVVEIAKEQFIKKLPDGSMWLKNPVSGFYYSLRFEKDIFSTLNQGTGVFVFDSWVMNMRKKGVNPNMQYHDEVLLSVSDDEKEDVKHKLIEAMDEVNESLKLNVDISVDVEFGENYAECH